MDVSGFDQRGGKAKGKKEANSSKARVAKAQAARAKEREKARPRRGFGRGARAEPVSTRTQDRCHAAEAVGSEPAEAADGAG
eukprot:2978757-Amphidinium_carterae.2